MIQASLIAFLRANVIAAGQRVYAQQLPQRPTYPALVVTWIAAPREYHLRGQTDLVFGTTQIDCLASGYQAALDLAEAVRMALSGYRGVMGSDEVTGVRVEDLSDTFEAPPSGRQVGPCRVTLEVSIGSKEAMPSFS